MAFSLPPLPYAEHELEPYISVNTLQYHHGKHHQTYVTKLNELLENHPLKGKSLEEVIQASAGKADLQAIFNNAAQVWNHTFYWHCMKKGGGGQPSLALLQRLEKDFKSFDEFCAQFKEVALSQFGSGWAWLVEKENRLQIMKTVNADLPMAHGAKALLTVDVWEHAYYLDYQNRRPDYVTTFLKNLVNWDFVESQL